MYFTSSNPCPLSSESTALCSLSYTEIVSLVSPLAFIRKVLLYATNSQMPNCLFVANSLNQFTKISAAPSKWFHIYMSLVFILFLVQTYIFVLFSFFFRSQHQLADLHRLPRSF